MKKAKFFAVLGVALSLSFAGAGIAACQFVRPGYQITINESLSVELTVGEEVDFTKYFFVTDRNGDPVTVTEDMLDLSQADTSLPGTFTVKISCGGKTQEIKFTVMPKKTDDDEGGTTKPNDPVDDPDTPVDELSAVIKKYADMSKWSFAVDFKEELNGESYEEHYEYLGYNVLYAYEDDFGDCTDYLAYDPATDSYTYYWDFGDGDYEAVPENDEFFDELYYDMYLIDPYSLGDFEFTQSGNKYSAKDPIAAGNKFIGEFYDDNGTYSWVSFDVYLSNGWISKIVAVLNDGDTMTFTFSKQGSVSFTLPNGQGGNQGGNQGGTDDPTDPNMMEKQVYNSNTFDNERLQDKMAKDKSANGLPSIGLPSTGNYHALVVPVQFKGDTITSTQMENLKKAFNGTPADTGWQSVNSYYKTSSNGTLDITFDIQTTVYNAKNSSSYYESKGDYATTILKEVLTYYEDRLDLTQYDYNNDGYIDAVYLIYSAPVSYDPNEGDYYWAYVSWAEDSTRYDGLYSNYFLFAGFDFMDESTSRQKSSLNADYPIIPNLKINASTFIHETGHLLGLDDYYDTDPTKGSNEGVGGADMMDYNIGDHGVYSKIMLGWLDATVVNETTTITIQASAMTPSATPSVLLIPLDFDNSYFSEYLLIDLYAATGLNEMHAGLEDTYLYGGSEFGVRIYHVSSSIENPYAEDGYGSFTDCNNSVTSNALIKLVEADGDKKFSSNRNGIAEADDLWKAGDVFSKKFPSYARNDGKTVNFDIEIVSVSSTSATITVTFKN